MIVRFLCFAAMLAVLVACKAPPSSSHQAKASTPPIQVKVQPVVYRSVPRLYSATGYTNVSRTVEISASQSGTIDQLTVKEGDLVSQGALLMVLDESELITSIKRAESALKSAEIRLKDLAKDLENARLLREKRVITIDGLRKARVQHKLAETQLEQAKSELEKQLARKPYHRIHSPIDARITKRWVDQGDLAVIGKPLLQLEAIKGLEFETAVPSKWVNTLQIGDIYPLTIHDRQKPINAVISNIVNSVDRVTQTCQVKLAISDATQVDSGLSGQIDFVIASEMHLLVASTALVRRAGVVGVFRAVNKQAVFTPVSTERPWENYRVILSGLEPKDNVITNPPSNLKDGTDITALGVQLDGKDQPEGHAKNDHLMISSPIT